MKEFHLIPDIPEVKQLEEEQWVIIEDTDVIARKKLTLKEIKKLCFSINDEILRKYVLEDFLEKIKRLTPHQSIDKFKSRFKKYGKQDFRDAAKEANKYVESSPHSENNIKIILQENKKSTKKK